MAKKTEKTAPADEKVEQVETAPEAPEAPENTAPEAPSEEAFVVCKGKALTSGRGILSDGASISAKDLAGGDEAFEAFIKGGYIEKASK